MPLTIKARDNTTTKNSEGNTNAKISPAPSMAKMSPIGIPLDLFISTPPFLFANTLYAVLKKVLKIFVGDKNQRCALFYRYSGFFLNSFVTHAKAAERR